jgi:hypothetical protein
VALERRRRGDAAARAHREELAVFVSAEEVPRGDTGDEDDQHGESDRRAQHRGSQALQP